MPVNLLDLLTCRLASGSLSYYDYKWKLINKASIDTSSIILGDVIAAPYIDERIVEYSFLLTHLASLNHGGLILDAGSAMNHESLLNAALARRISVFIQTLAPESFRYKSPMISYIYRDLRDKVYSSGIFDFVSCISTLEHVGLDNSFLYGGMKESSVDDNQIVRILDNFYHCLKPGGVALVTIPVGVPFISSWIRVFDAHQLSDIIGRSKFKTIKSSFWRNHGYQWKCVCIDDVKDARYLSPLCGTPKSEARLMPGAEGLSVWELSK